MLFHATSIEAFILARWSFISHLYSVFLPITAFEMLQLRLLYKWDSKTRWNLLHKKENMSYHRLHPLAWRAHWPPVCLRTWVDHERRRTVAGRQKSYSKERKIKPKECWASSRWSKEKNWQRRGGRRIGLIKRIRDGACASGCWLWCARVTSQYF